MLLCGETPRYRLLDEGVSGPDVRELNRNLVELGYAKRSDVKGTENEFGSPTADALSRAPGRPRAGGERLAGARRRRVPARAAADHPRLGDARDDVSAGAPVAQATSTRRRVEVALDPTEAGTVAVGDRARVVLPDNSTTAGKVTRIGHGRGRGSGSASGEESESTSSTIPVYVKLERDNDAGAIDEAPVRVEITTDRVKDALSVPVTALLARAGGGYAVETVGDDGQRELVSVELGPSTTPTGSCR